MKNKITQFLLALTLSLSISPTLITQAAGEALDSDAVITTEPAIFNATVPTGLPVHVSEDGTITVSDSAYIINGSPAPIELSGVEVIPVEGWDLLSMDSDYTNKPVDSTEFGMDIFDIDVYNQDTFFFKPEY